MCTLWECDDDDDDDDGSFNNSGCCLGVWLALWWGCDALRWMGGIIKRLFDALVGWAHTLFVKRGSVWLTAGSRIVQICLIRLLFDENAIFFWFLLRYAFEFKYENSRSETRLTLNYLYIEVVCVCSLCWSSPSGECGDSVLLHKFIEQLVKCFNYIRIQNSAHSHRSMTSAQCKWFVIIYRFFYIYICLIYFKLLYINPVGTSYSPDLMRAFYKPDWTV